MSDILYRKFFNLSKEKNCPICMDEIEKYDDAFISKHCCCSIFHEYCIKTNFLEYGKTDCPMCKTEFNIDDIRLMISEEISVQSESDDDDDEVEYMCEKKFQRLLCNCTQCDDITKKQRIKIAIIDDDIKKLNRLLNQHTDLKLSNLSNDSLGKLLVFSIENGSFRCISFIIKHKKHFVQYYCNDVLNINRASLSVQISYAFRAAVYDKHNKVAKLVLDNFCISVTKEYLEDFVKEYNTEIYDYIKQKSKLDEITQTYINFDLRN